MPTFVNEHKTIFPGKRGQLWNFTRIFSAYWSFLYTCSEVCQKPKSNLLCNWMLIKNSKMQNLFDEYKIVFLEKWGKCWNFPKNFSIYCSFPKICFEVRKKRKSKLLSHGLLIKAFILPNLVNKYKTIFPGENLRTFQKLCRYIGVSYKLVLKSAKSLNQIFCAIECWQKTQKYKICLRNTKLFFWENETIFETSRKLSPYIAVFYKFIWKPLWSINRSFWATKYWFKSL